MRDTDTPSLKDKTSTAKAPQASYKKTPTKTSWWKGLQPWLVIGPLLWALHGDQTTTFTSLLALTNNVMSTQA